MPRAIHFLVSSSGVVSSLLHRWKPHISGGISSTPISAKSLSTSRRAATQQFFPEFSASRSDFLRAFRVPATCSDSYADGGSSSPPPPTFQPLAHLSEVSFCQWCGGPMKQAIPDGDEKKRAICTLCGKISYRNPKMVVGCLVEHDNKVLLCQRKIPPSDGLWTLPSGYMEIGESALEGAIRETWEEAGADVEVLSPFAQLDIPLIGQTYIFFRARLKKPQFAPGPESLDCQLFALKDIPFDSLAFSSMLVTLNMYAEDLKTGKPKFHYGTINKRPDSGPSEIHAYTIDCHLQS